MKYLAVIVLTVFIVSLMITTDAFNDAEIRGRQFDDQQEEIYNG